MTTLPSALFGTTPPTATTQSYYPSYPTQPTYPTYPAQPTYGQDQFSAGLTDLRNRVYQMQAQLQQAGAGVQGNAAWVTAVNDLSARVAQYQQAVGNVNYGYQANPYAALLQDLTARCNQMRQQVAQPAYPGYPQTPGYPTYPPQPSYPTRPTYPGTQQPGYGYQQPTYPGTQQPGYGYQQPADPLRDQRRMMRRQHRHQMRQPWQQQPMPFSQPQNPLEAIVGMFQGLTQPQR